MTANCSKLIIYLSILLTLSGCEDTMAEYEWIASEASPLNYPMQVVNGTFTYPGGDSGLYIPDSKLLYYGWGKPVSTHVVGPEKKPLPDRLAITFYSFTEDQFYQGEFELPHDLIVERFSEGYTSASENASQSSFRKIVAGITPGGHVAVWLVGSGKQEEIFFGKAKPIDYDWTQFWESTFQSQHPDPRAQFRMETLSRDRFSKALSEAQNGAVPVDKWSRFREEYPWEPRFYRMPEPHLPVHLKYLNGERYHLRPPYNVEQPRDGTLPMPREISFKSDGHLFIIHFDEDEMLKVFESMAEGERRLYLDIAPTIPRSETQIRLRDEGDNTTTLEKFTLEEIN